jgi:tetratricopeptide (TPR) repeat protein
MGRAQFELGNFHNALNTFKMAAQLTPSSVNRLLKHGMMAWYAGERAEGLAQMDRATRIGLDSKLYDAQALVLMAFERLDNNEHRALVRCQENLEHLIQKQPEKPRLQRLLDVVNALIAIHDYQTAQALEAVRRMAKTIHQPDFDFESGGNLLGLMTRLAMRSIQLYEVDAAVDTLGLRFCTSRALTELLCCSATGRPDFINRVRQAHSDILKLTEEAMALSLKGDPQSAVVKLLADGERTLNAKLIESAHLVLQRYQARIPEHAALLTRAQTLREQYRTTDIHAGLGEQAATGRAAGGLSLSSGYKAHQPDGLLAKFGTVGA